MSLRVAALAFLPFVGAIQDVRRDVLLGDHADHADHSSFGSMYAKAASRRASALMDAAALLGELAMYSEQPGPNSLQRLQRNENEPKLVVAGQEKEAAQGESFPLSGLEHTIEVLGTMSGHPEELTMMSTPPEANGLQSLHSAAKLAAVVHEREPAWWERFPFIDMKRTFEELAMTSVKPEADSLQRLHESVAIAPALLKREDVTAHESQDVVEPDLDSATQETNRIQRLLSTSVAEEATNTAAEQGAASVGPSKAAAGAKHSIGRAAGRVPKQRRTLTAVEIDASAVVNTTWHSQSA